ncbi:hypothetical protein KSP39_PZI022935 [Platanthera zijinensis]|uniref:Uncharacterized protein n=1 Tax=Platanthera zijinensis TaxID=2320716 RepID=A0AAP0AUX4_9ASPA
MGLKVNKNYKFVDDKMKALCHSRIVGTRGRGRVRKTIGLLCIIRQKKQLRQGNKETAKRERERQSTSVLCLLQCLPFTRGETEWERKRAAEGAEKMTSGELECRRTEDACSLILGMKSF